MGIIYVKMYINSFSYMCRLGHLSDSAAIIIQINIFFCFQSHTGHVLSSILLNSTDLLRVNLPGVDIVIPHLIAALEIVLSQTDFNMRYIALKYC